MTHVSVCSVEKSKVNGNRDLRPRQFRGLSVDLRHMRIIQPQIWGISINLKSFKFHNFLLKLTNNGKWIIRKDVAMQVPGTVSALEIPNVF